MIRSLKNRISGVSLVELITAVAITGILAAVAVPSYIHSVHKSKQSEAKANLATLDSNMKSFWTEYASYTSRLDSIGFQPEGDQNYVYGFTLDVIPPGVRAARVGTANCVNTIAGSPCPSVFVRWKNTPQAVAASSTFAADFAAAFGVNPTPNGFKAIAASNFGLPADDVWSINSQDLLLNSAPNI